MTRIDYQGCDHLDLLNMIPRGRNATRTDTSHSAFLDTQPLELRCTIKLDSLVFVTQEFSCKRFIHVDQDHRKEEGNQ